MFGIWSIWSHKWCFGIMAPSKEDAWNRLEYKIGTDANRARFEVRRLSRSDQRIISAERQRYIQERNQIGRVVKRGQNLV